MIDSCNVQVAEFAFPFPAEIFKTELIDKEIDFREFHKDSYEGGSGSVIFYVSNKDFDEAFLLKEEVDKENAVSEEKYKHPIEKYIRWFFLICFICFLIYKLIDFFISDNMILTK